MFCSYKNIFGEPKKGVHAVRFLGVAIVDVVATVAVAAIIAYLFTLNFIFVLLILFLLGIVLHRVFCVETTVDTLLLQLTRPPR